MNNHDSLKREELSKNSKMIGVRFPPKVYLLIEAKAKEEGISISKMIRDSVIEYLDRTFLDTEIIHQSLIESSRKLSYLDDKMELLSLICLGMVKELKKSLPARPEFSNELLDELMQDFEKNCVKSLKNQHPGKLEQMLINIYEREA